MKKLLLGVLLSFIPTLAFSTPTPREELVEALAGSYILTLENEKLTIDIDRNLEGIVWQWAGRDVRKSIPIYISNISDEGIPPTQLITLNLQRPGEGKTPAVAVYLWYKQLDDGKNHLLYLDTLEFEGTSAKKLDDVRLEKRIHRSGLTEVIPPV